VTREQTVQSLVRLDEPLPLLEAQLRTLPWDWEGPALATLDGAAVVSILRRHAAGELTDEQVKQWAGLVEVRDDVDFTPDASEAVFWLANPSINGSLAEVGPALLSRLA
jgi:hypothetical protein